MSARRILQIAALIFALAVPRAMAADDAAGRRRTAEAVSADEPHADRPVERLSIGRSAELADPPGTTTRAGGGGPAATGGGPILADAQRRLEPRLAPGRAPEHQRHDPQRESRRLICRRGALAVGSGTVQIPGVVLTGNVATMIFTYLISHQEVNRRTFASSAVSQDQMLEVALAYIELLRAEGQYAVAQLTRDDARELARLTAAYVKAGQGRQGRRRPRRHRIGPAGGDRHQVGRRSRHGLGTLVPGVAPRSYDAAASDAKNGSFRVPSCPNRFRCRSS